jgi:uncharacterized protein
LSFHFTSKALIPLTGANNFAHHHPVQLGIAFFEYCFQVPANGYGSYEFTGAQLKTIQEVITLTVFSVFSITYLGEPFKWNYAAGFAFICAGVFFVFHQW